jgi:ribosome-associated translation inhibitor RaiA
MFAWITSQKEDGHLPLSAASRDCLEKIAQRLKEAAPDDSLPSPEVVLEKLLTGQLSLVSTLAFYELVLDQDDITLGSPAQALTSPQVPPAEAPGQPDAAGSTAHSTENSTSDLADQAPLAAPTDLDDQSVPAATAPPSAPSPEPYVVADESSVIDDLHRQIEHLQTRLNQQHDHSAEPNESSVITNLHQQIEHLQTRLNQRRDHQAAQQAKLTALLKKNHQQEAEIADLKAQVDRLRASASIGESQLNRWRFNNFSR